jgi:hypothetical protein
MSETGSTTGWGVGSSVPSSPTIQSYQTAEFQAESKWAVSVGGSAGIVPHFRSLQRPLRSLRPILASRLRIQKFRSPQWGLQPPRPLGIREYWEPLGQNGPFCAWSAIIAGSIPGLRTAGSNLREYHEVARLQCRVANDLQPSEAS